MVDRLSALFQSLAPLWEMSVTAAYASAIVMVLRLLLKKRAPRQVLCLLWLVVFARLLIPVTLESPLSIVPSALPGQEQQTVLPNTPQAPARDSIQGQPNAGTADPRHTRERHPRRPPRPAGTNRLPLAGRHRRSMAGGRNRHGRIRSVLLSPAPPPPV